MRTFIALLFVLAVSSVSADARAGTLDRVAESGTFRIGYVPDAPPLSFRDAKGDAVGYSIDLCRHIAAAVKIRLDLEDLKLEFVPLVSMQERIRAVESGRVDIECGATTVTLSRRERVDFTLMTFITGSAVLSRRGNAINTLDDVADQTVAVLRDTTTETVLRRAIEINELDVKLRLVDSREEGMRLLNEGKVIGYASDRAMLIGQIFRNENAQNQYALTRSVLSFEPYALMLPRGDTNFRLVADKALASLYRSARIRRLYHTWFGRYGEPLSPIVEAMYQFQAVEE